MNAILIDTNVLIYAYDANDLTRQTLALNLLKRLEANASGRLSVQCLAECFSVSTRKLSPRLTPAEATTQVDLLSRTFPILDLTPGIVLEAARGVRDHQLAYYDAQLWATAKLNQIATVFSEDFAAGSVLEGIRFVNPFASDFVMEQWTG